ncbi:MAG: cytochrome-c peroxidase [Sandaracinus sp.]
MLAAKAGSTAWRAGHRDGGVMKHGKRVGGLFVGIGIGLVGCRPGPVPVIDPQSTNGDLSSAISLDPRIDAASRGEGRALPPITGGTLHVTRAGTIVVSDPDRDRVVLVDLATQRVMGEVRLPEGAFPARIAEDAEGHVHVVLRGRGEILSFDPYALGEASRHATCAEPRGLAFDERADVLRVACRDGSLDTLSLTGERLSREQLGVDDLRDVLVVDGRFYVTTFRSAEIHVFDAQLHPISTAVPTSRTDTTNVTGEVVDFLPEVAWRTVLDGGRLVMVHQRGAERVVAPPTQPSYYGNGFLCGGSVVESVVTTFEIDPITGSLREDDHVSVLGATLPVDVAVDADGGVLMVSAAEQGLLPSAYRVDLRENALYGAGPCDTAFATTPAIEGGGAIAVASQGEHTLIQLRDPAAIVIDGRAVALGGESRVDAGHALFHGNAGLGLACASCHPEGGDDGRVWQFPGFAPLRTPALRGGIVETAPFHWQGDMPSMGALMNEVFERRMGGPAMAPRHEDALSHWVDALPGSSPREVDTAAADRGARLFWGEAECGSCHTGAMLTDNRNYDVGTGMTLQVPPLVGVSYRLPVMHDGCADTLRARFEPDCGGGDRHGHTSQLTEAQLADLVTYLETL